MTIPILLDHDPAKPVGFAEVVDGKLEFRFASDVKITKDMVDQIFGNVCIRILEAVQEDGARFIQRGQILEWSLSPEPVPLSP